MAIAKRKKRFYDVEIPIINRQTQLQAFELKDLDGRFIKYDFTRALRGKNLLVSLKVNVKEEKAIATPREIKLMSYFLRKVVRKGTNYVEDSFSTECKDAQIRIKPFLITRRKVSRKVRKALREKAKEELINYAKKQTFETIFEEVLRNQLQKSLSLKLKKIYPLSLCEIRVLKVEKELEKKVETKTKEKESPVEKKETKAVKEKPKKTEEKETKTKKKPPVKKKE